MLITNFEEFLQRDELDESWLFNFKKGSLSHQRYFEDKVFFGKEVSLKVARYYAAYFVNGLISKTKVKTRKDSLHNISRGKYSGKSGKAWRVRILRIGKEYNKIFYDHLEGGHEESLLKAKKWRDRYLSLLPISQVVPESSPRNNTGIPGIQETEFAYAAFLPKTKQMKTFSKNKYGRMEAFLLALEARQIAVEELTAYRLRRRDPQLAAKTRTTKLDKRSKLIKHS